MFSKPSMGGVAVPTRIEFKLLSDVVPPSELYPLTLAFSSQLPTNINVVAAAKVSHPKPTGEASAIVLAVSSSVPYQVVCR